MLRSTRECWFSDSCMHPAAYRVYSEPLLIPIGNGMVMSSTAEAYLCVRHLREQMRKEHEKGNTLYIERV
jgi:hypothetical protein